MFQKKIPFLFRQHHSNDQRKKSPNLQVHPFSIFIVGYFFLTGWKSMISFCCNHLVQFSWFQFCCLHGKSFLLPSQVQHSLAKMYFSLQVRKKIVHLPPGTVKLQICQQNKQTNFGANICWAITASNWLRMCEGVPDQQRENVRGWLWYLLKGKDSCAYFSWVVSLPCFYCKKSI